MWILTTSTRKRPALTFRLPSSTMKTLGRATRSDFIVDVAMVSRVHCRFTTDHAGELVVGLRRGYSPFAWRQAVV